MPEFLRRLRREAMLFLFSRSMLALIGGLLLWPILVLAVDAYDLFFPILEQDALFWVVGALGLSVLSLLLALGYFLRKTPSSAEMARQVEEANPDLLDTLNCAVELEGKSKTTELSFMEKRVLAVTEEKAKQLAWGRGTRPGSTYWVSLLIGLIMGGALSGWSMGSSPVLKAFDSMSEEPGLSVFTTKTGSAQASTYEASAEFSRGTDVSVFADVTRGHRGSKYAFIEFVEEGETVRMDMLSTPIMGRFEFVVPALRDDFKYRVSTPSIEGDWHRLTPYDPPSLTSAKWKVKPPAYLRQDNIEHVGFGYLRVPEGSEITLQLEVGTLPERVQAVLRGSDGNRTLTQVASQTFEHRFVLIEEWSGLVELSDSEKPDRDPIAYDEVVLSPIPDEPPLVEITEPAKDLQLPADAQFLLEVYASDDHGVADVRINVSHAGKQEEETIFVEPEEKEKSLAYVFDLNERALAVGDVITYMALAVDNKEPEGQIARSEIYFIEVLPPEGNSTENEGDGEGEMESKEIPVRDFINKTKKIIRSTYDGMLERDEVLKERASLAIAADALGLKHQMTKVYDENEGAFPIQDGIDLGELLNEATYHIEQTEIYAGDLMLEDSLEPSEKTLRKLVQLYALLRKMQKQKSKGKGKPQEQSETSDESEPQEQAEESESLAEQLEDLGKDLKKLEELQDRQKDLNAEIGRSAGSGAKGERNQRSSQEQEEIRRDLEEIREDWYDRSGKLGEVANLDLAGDEMKDSAGDLRRDDPRGAQPHGDLAAEALGDAISQVEGKMAGLASRMVDQLSDRAEGLAQRQGDLAEETERASPGQGESLKNLQDELNEELKDFLEQMDQTARSLGNFNENAMEDLLESARESREGGLESSGKRASNSLLYEAFPQAKREEEKVERNLEDLQEDMEGVADKLRNLGNQALQELVENLMRMQQELPGMGEEEMRQSSSEIADSLGALKNSDEHERLQNVTRFFEQLAISEDPLGSKSMADAAVSEALELAEQFFWREAKENLLRRNQATTAAPGKYKKQVQEYFRRIAEGE